jgi:signal transduction histidine kinase
VSDVSCKIFELFIRPLSSRGVPLESIVVGTRVPVAMLRSKKDRMPWSDFVAIMRNTRPHFTDAEYVELGRKFLQASGLRFASVIARLLYSPLDFYRWFMKPREGVGNQMFACVKPSITEVSERELLVDLLLPDGYEMCWDFFIISGGNFEQIPKFLGLPRAEVDLTRLPNGCRYRIQIPSGSPLLVRIRRWLTWPFTVRAAARELQAAHESLLDRFEELEEARGKLDRQASHLRVAHAVNDLLLRDVELSTLIATLVAALVKTAGFPWAKLSLDNGDAQLAAEAGKSSEETKLVRAVEAQGGEVIGELQVGIGAASDLQEREDLLALITPALSTGLQNAMYRTSLERIVDERTTELRLARDELAGTVQQLRQAQGARERFFGNISHEFRTPLSIIVLAVADIQQRAGSQLDARVRGDLGAVSDSARKLLRLVDELLLLAAGQEDKLRINPEPTDLVALVGQLVSAWRPSADAAGLAFEARTPARLIANVDPVAIERVATNLISNAVKYTPSGGRVDIEVAVTDDGILFAVLDTGPGIADELTSRLFGRFERGAGADRRKAGTGIGLALAKQLVEAHQGTIEARARPTGGSELRVLLPSSALILDAPPAVGASVTLQLETLPLPAAPNKGTRLAPPGVSKGTIVLAEDDERLAEIVARGLADEYTVMVAHDGLSAYELVRAHQPQLLITDVDMPGPTGIELAEKFRDHLGDKLAPIIILSALLDRGTRLAGLEAGAIDYVTKPFDPIELKARVRAQFRMRDLAVRLHRAEQLSSLGILTSGLAHELRNPANGIVNAIGPLAELLPAELRDPDSAVGQLVDVIRGCADQISFLSRQLLGFRSGITELELRAVAMTDLIERSTSLAQRALEGVSFRSYFAPDLELVCAPPLLTQVLTNLIENAGHAAGRGGWIEVRAATSEERIEIELSDSGPGVPLQLRDRVFEPFFTTKPAGIGTGLGLSLSRDIIHRHGGLLEIRDRGARSCFVIDLPRRSTTTPSPFGV